MAVPDDVAAAVIVSLSARELDLLPHFTHYLQKPELGGLEGLLQKFERNGLGPQVRSWTGANPLPVRPDDVVRAMGAPDIAELAVAAGVPRDVLARLLAKILPLVVRRISLSGRLPGNRLTENLTALLH